MSALVCEHADHVGDRLITHRADLLEERTEWRRLSDQGREFVRIRRRVCIDCARRDASNEDVNQGALL